MTAGRRTDIGVQDPLNRLRQITGLADRWTTEAVHRVAIGMEQSAVTGEVRTRPSYDRDRRCPECGPRIAEYEVERILDGFACRDARLDVVQARRVDSAVRSLRRRGLPYVAAPAYTLRTSSSADAELDKRLIKTLLGKAECRSQRCPGGDTIARARPP